MAFLTARWSNLCLLTYAVPRSVLAGRLPPGLELDSRPGLVDGPAAERFGPDGPAFVSLVAFDFLDTRVLGIPWPGYRNFPEINLRFYVRRPAAGGGAGDGAAAGGGAERGVVFVREFVPQRLVAFLARAAYNEPYLAAPMASRVTRSGDAIEVEHRLTFGGRTNTIAVVADGPAACPAATSTEHFFKEHQWGYGTARGGKLLRYEVVHGLWDCYRVRSWRLDWDWAAVYGPEWAFLKDEQPVSTVLAVGSGVSVHPHSSPL